MQKQLEARAHRQVDGLRCRVRRRYASAEPHLFRLTVTVEGFTLVHGDGLIFSDSTCLEPNGR